MLDLDCVARSLEFLDDPESLSFNGAVDFLVYNTGKVSWNCYSPLVQAANAFAPEMANEKAKLEYYILAGPKFLGARVISYSFLIFRVSNIIGCKKDECIAYVTVGFELFDECSALIRFAV